MRKAFVLGAGLGTRLRPLTDQLPKPLIPVFHRPLITYAFDHLLATGVREFVVNTHHLQQRYAEAFPGGTYRGAPITFRHEPVLLETAGGISNVADLLDGESFFVYNGDILTDLPLAPLLRAHEESGNMVTLVLRSTGPAIHVAFDPASGLVTDIRNMLGTGHADTHQFTGVYAVSPSFLKHLTPGKIESVIPVFLRLIESGARLGGVVIDEGHWWDLGDRESYLAAHRTLWKLGSAFPMHHNNAGNDTDFVRPVEAHSKLDPTVRLLGLNVISTGAGVGPGAILEDCILWPHARVAENARLARCIVRSGMTAVGDLGGEDV